MITLLSHTSHALQPLDENSFKPFKTSFRKERDNSMVKNNYNELDKATFVAWVDKALNVILSKTSRVGFRL
jgi:two-component SAPR family response regulator